MSYLIEAFKSHEQNRLELAAILSSQTFLKACNAVLEDEKLGNPIVPDNDAIVSVRVLSRITGMEDFVRQLHSLTVLDRPVVQQASETWQQEDAARKLFEAQNNPTQP